MKNLLLPFLTAMLFVVAFLTACSSTFPPSGDPQNAPSITTITISGSEESVKSSAYESCANIKTVVIQSGVITIETQAFKDCISLEKIYIPRTVTTIEFQAFKNYRHLNTVYYGGTESEWNSITLKGGNNYLRGAKNIYYNQVAF